MGTGALKVHSESGAKGTASRETSKTTWNPQRAERVEEQTQERRQNIQGKSDRGTWGRIWRGQLWNVSGQATSFAEALNTYLFASPSIAENTDNPERMTVEGMNAKKSALNFTTKTKQFRQYFGPTDTRWALQQDNIFNDKQTRKDRLEAWEMSNCNSHWIC